MPKRIVSVYLDDNILSRIDRLREDEAIKKEVGKKKLSRNDVIEYIVNFYWNSKTLNGMLELG